MTAYYCNPGAGGANDGTSWADAWDGSVSGSALQDAIDGANGTAPAAGDVVYCKGTDSISAAIDIDGNSGSYAAGHIKFIGVNAATTNAPPQASDYGEYFTIDGGNNTINGIDFGLAGVDYIWLENIKVTQCDGTGATPYAVSRYYATGAC